MPGDFSQPDQNPSTQGTPELVPAQEDDEERTEPYEDDDTPVLTEEDIAQLQEEDVDTEPYNSDHSHFVDVDGIVFVPIAPKITGAPDFGSYDVSGFNQFEQYLAKNGKKQPKAESVITQEVLRKYAKEIRQAKLEEFRSFLDFTAMTFRDKRRHKIDNAVTGRWVLTIKVDKDGQFKKFKARWVCRGLQDAQKYDLQTDSPTATRYGFRVASQHAASMYWDLLHLDLKTAFLQGETYDLDRRVIHVQLPTDIGLPPYLVGLCTRSFYGLADAPRRCWNRLYYVSSPQGEVTQHESSDIAGKFISLFWLKKDCFQLVINNPKLGNRELSSNRRRLKTVLDLLLLMKPCRSFWTLLNINLAGILLKMVMLKFLNVQKP